MRRLTTPPAPNFDPDTGAAPAAPAVDPALIAEFTRTYLAQRAEQEEAARAAANPAPTAPALNANAGQAEGDTRVAVRAERGASWQRRAARYIRAQILSTGSYHQQEEARQLMTNLVMETLDLPAAQVAQERQQAEQIADRASRSDLNSGHRIRMVLDQHEDGLSALRAVPTGQRTMSTLSDVAGGYLVPEPMMAELLYFMEQYGYARRFFRTVNMTSDTLEWAKLGTKPVAAWYGELERIDPSDMTFGEGGLSSAKLAGITSWSREMEEDALVALLPVYIQLMGEAMAQKEDLAAFLGDGTATYGGQRGIFDLTGAGEATVYTLPSGKTSSAQVILEYLIAAKNSISKARRRNAKWLLPESVITALVSLKRNNEANNFVLLDPNSDVGIARLLGYPVLDAEGVEDAFFPTDAAGTVFGAFGDFNRSIFGVRRGFTVETTREGVLNNAAGAVTLNALQQDAVIAKVTERVAIGHPQPDAYVLLKTAAS